MHIAPLDDVWVAIDTETTGLEARRHKIIEVGVVKFRGDEVIDTFQTFVNPGERLTPFIRGYTGITQRQVDAAPPFQRVAGDIAKFVGDHPIVGHNLGFDLGFLAASGLNLSSPGCDTLDLARVFAASSPDFSLTGLAMYLGVEANPAHRAADDAHTTSRVFVELLRRASKVDLKSLQQIERIAARSLDSPLRRVMGQLVGDETVRRAQMSLDERHEDIRGLARSRRERDDPANENPAGYDLESLRLRAHSPPPLAISEDDDDPIDIEAVGEAFGEEGVFASTLEGFERRAEQVEMAEAVAVAINKGQRLIVEAGTGVGKSLAYLLPAALYAAANDKRVVISTNTINLQEQIIEKDIPALLEAMSLMPDAHPHPLKYALLKGRANYLCLQRWGNLKNSDSVSPEDARLLSSVLLWLDETSTGDKNERNFEWAWSHVSAQGASGCRGHGGVCFMRTARARAAASHLVVVNHALLLTDIVRGGGIIPEYDVLIIDEAHHLESEATTHLGFQIGRSTVLDLLQSAYDERGLLTKSIEALSRFADTAESRRTAAEFASSAEESRALFQGNAEALFGLLRESFGRRDERERQLRVVDQTRRESRWSDAEVVWGNVDIALADLQRTLTQAEALLNGLGVPDDGEVEALRMEASARAVECGEIRGNLKEFVTAPSAERVYWIEAGARPDDVTLRGAPLHVGESLEERLYSRKRSVVFTSATLAANNSFDHLEERTGFRDAERRLLGSPFDYESAAIVCIPTDMPQPNDPNYVEAAAKAIADVATAAGGRTMALFTSYATLRGAADALRPRMRSEGIELLVQEGGGSPHRILTRFRENPRSIILGTSSFWEGVDIAGDALQALVVTRLPFNVPTEPVFEARSELYDNAFFGYAVPLAILRLRQGFGRLIRSKTDRGVVVMLDKRVVSRSYGSMFLKSLPPATKKRCALRDLHRETQNWLNA